MYSMRLMGSGHLTLLGPAGFASKTVHSKRLEQAHVLVRYSSVRYSREVSSHVTFVSLLP